MIHYVALVLQQREQSKVPPHTARAEQSRAINMANKKLNESKLLHTQQEAAVVKSSLLNFYCVLFILRLAC